VTDRPRSLKAFGDTVDGLYLVDHQQRIVRWNAGAERLLGYAPSEVLHRKCHDVIGGRLLDGSVMCRPDCLVHCSVARGELPQGIEGHARAKDGRQVRLRVDIIVIPYRPRPLIAHVLHGVGDRAPTAGDVRARSDRRRPALTPRERQVLRLVADGMSNARIAGKLGVSTFTVRNHVQHILTKSGAHNRAEAVAFAFLGRLL
jgi:PAS domain S-box-containing protein